MGNTLATDTIPVLITMIDVHYVQSQDQYYFCSVSSGGQGKVIGRSQTLSVEVGITTVLSCTVYACTSPTFSAECATCVGLLNIPIERLAERYSSGIFQQWFKLDTHTDPRQPAGDAQTIVRNFERAYAEAVADVNSPKICVSVIGSAFEVQRGGRQTCSIFVGEDVKTQAGPDLKALIASHKQQAAYIDALHEELRRLKAPSYRSMPTPGMPGNGMQGGGIPGGGGMPGGGMPMQGGGGMTQGAMQGGGLNQQAPPPMPPMQPPGVQRPMSMQPASFPTPSNIATMGAQ